jgi:hypothetical protein
MVEAAPEQPERRLVRQLLAYWRTLAGTRPFPAISDIVPTDIPAIWPSCFLAGIIGGANGSKLLEVGRLLSAEIEGEATGRPLMSLPKNSLLGEASGYLSQVLAFRSPWTASGEYELNGIIYVYRGCLLPLGPAPGRVNGVLGAASKAPRPARQPVVEAPKPIQ